MRLALQSLYIVGASINDENTELRQIHFNADEGFTSILAGKEFMLMISSSGKVFSVVKAICVLKVKLSLLFKGFISRESFLFRVEDGWRVDP